MQSGNASDGGKQLQMVFVETNVGIAGIQVDHSQNPVEDFQRNRQYASNMPDPTLSVPPKVSVAGTSLHNTATPSEKTCETMVRLTAPLVRLAPPIPTKNRGPLPDALVAKQNRRAVGRGD